jgi:hypothetical protein
MSGGGRNLASEVYPQMKSYPSLRTARNKNNTLPSSHAGRNIKEEVSEKLRLCSALASLVI